MLEINQKYLAHDDFTDIITFDQSEIDKCLSGDIFISVERAKENATALKLNVENEIRRLLVHGVLHLIGYNDKSEEEKTLMTEKEDYYLSLCPKNN